MKIIRQTTEQTAQVRKAQKSTHYTVSVIGTKEDLKQWKAYQAIKEAEWQKAQVESRQAKRQNAVSVVNGGTPARPLTEVEKAELVHRAARTKGRPDENPRSMLATPTLTYIDAPQPSKPLLDRFKSICANIWRNAFDSER